jgi:hypothetical protein
MSNTELHTLKYPIGEYVKTIGPTKEELGAFISDIHLFPQRLREAVESLTQAQLDTRYRADGWTIRQVIHHCADSHMNSFIRFKLALTEDNPTIKPYWEDRWAELVDSKMAIEFSLHILDGLHTRWTALLDSLTVAELKKTFSHPEHTTPFKIDEYIGMYAWHCNHHLAHITELIKRRSW